jgi:hypothetical protein
MAEEIHIHPTANLPKETKSESRAILLSPEKIILIRFHTHTPDGREQYWESIYEELNEEEARELAKTLNNVIRNKWGQREAENEE